MTKQVGFRSSSDVETRCRSLPIGQYVIFLSPTGDIRSRIRLRLCNQRIPLRNGSIETSLQNLSKGLELLPAALVDVDDASPLFERTDFSFCKAAKTQSKSRISVISW